MIKKFRDWWRGYSDVDLENVRTIVEISKYPGALRAGQITFLTEGEFKAMLANGAV